MNKTFSIYFAILVTSCSSLTGPEGLFPDTRYDFLDEEPIKTKSGFSRLLITLPKAIK